MNTPGESDADVALGLPILLCIGVSLASSSLRSVGAALCAATLVWLAVRGR